MKKFTLPLWIFLAIGLGASAQQQVRYGFKAGISSTNFGFSKSGNFEQSMSRNLSFYGGVIADIPAGNIFSIQPGLLFIGKGAKTSEAKTETTDGTEYSAEGVGTLNPFYIELPVNLVANIRTKAGKAFLGAGPYFAMGVAGKKKFKGTAVIGNTSTSVEASENIVFGDKPGADLKLSDFGINFLVGYELSNGINLHGGYNLGLSSISYGDGDGFKTMNRGFTVGLGYSF